MRGVCRLAGSSGIEKTEKNKEKSSGVVHRYDLGPQGGNSEQ